jgi:ribosomal protein L11 methyltransferase
MSRLPDKTYEIRVSFLATEARTVLLTKSQVILFLHNQGIDSFVEGAMDQLDLDPTDPAAAQQAFEDAGGGSSPLSIYRFDRDSLDMLSKQLQALFDPLITVELIESATTVWTEGWKESFRPILAGDFYVYPPWDKSLPPVNTKKIEIEPGMAFGTGQHATTQLCLLMIQNILDKTPSRTLENQNILDVGCGTGILAIATALSGAKSVTATDIDIDSISATEQNAERNHCIINVQQTSVPAHQEFDLVIANIIRPVLAELMPDLASATAPGGNCILSGLLCEDKEEMVSAAAAHGLAFYDEQQDKGWIGLLLEKKS